MNRLAMFGRRLLDNNEVLTYVVPRQIEPDESVQRRNADLVAAARRSLGARHILVRRIERPGDYWYTKRAEWRDIDARR